MLGERVYRGSGIEQLMEDLGNALAVNAGRVRMLGGGNPALIDGAEKVWRRRINEILGSGRDWERLLGVYDPPRGNSEFLRIVADYFRRKYGWDVGPENVVVTAGGQTAFFFLFNLLAGEMPGGVKRRVMLPLVPEYIGYAGQGLAEDFFVASGPVVLESAPKRFRYFVDFEKMEIPEDVVVMALSRPVNPSGYLLADDALWRLAEICRLRGIVLLVDNAYGMPFPGIVYRECRPIFAENVVNVFSFSKLGLPNVRTAIVVAAPEVARAVASMTAITGLANGTLGQWMVGALLESGEIDRLVEEVVRPYYRERLLRALGWLEESLGDEVDYRIHETGGAMFLWLWLPGLVSGSREFYLRLKERGVLVVPGRAFALGLSEVEPHADQCLRISFAMDDETLREGLREVGRLAKDFA